MENQLKAELRIGNYLFDRNNRLCQVKELGESITAPAIKGARTSLPNKPIPLSEDILVKLGFEKTANPRELKYGGYSILLLNEIRFVICNYMENPPSVKVSTVHQLQNLFFILSGEELIFKN